VCEEVLSYSRSIDEHNGSLWQFPNFLSPSPRSDLIDEVSIVNSTCSPNREYLVPCFDFSSW